MFICLSVDFVWWKHHWWEYYSLYVDKWYIALCIYIWLAIIIRPSWNLMSFWPQSSINGSASNLPDSTGRSFTTSFSGQSGAGSPVFHHAGGCKLLGSTFMYSSKLLKFNLLFWQEVCSRFITFMEALMFPTFQVHLHQETQQWITCHPAVFSSLLEAFLVDGLHQIIFLLLSLRYWICHYLLLF